MDNPTLRPDFSALRSAIRLAVLSLSLAACASTSNKEAEQAPADPGPDPIAELVEATNEPDPIGKLLSDLNLQIRRWTNLSMTARSPEDVRKARLLENNLTTITHKRRDELIEQLESGPLSNRVVAASALGFTHDIEAQSPLLAALDDPNVDVVSNALLGLALLGLPSTPLERVCELLDKSSDNWVRSNAALCAATLVAAGSRSDCILPVARLALNDDEPAVRAQCALILGTLVDVASIEQLSNRLFDPVPLVRGAASRSLAHIGATDMQQKGKAARALVNAFATEQGPPRDRLHESLVSLAQIDYGQEPEEWRAWALRLP